MVEGDDRERERETHTEREREREGEREGERERDLHMRTCSDSSTSLLVYGNLEKSLRRNTYSKQQTAAQLFSTTIVQYQSRAIRSTRCNHRLSKQSPIKSINRLKS